MACASILMNVFQRVTSLLTNRYSNSLTLVGVLNILTHKKIAEGYLYVMSLLSLRFMNRQKRCLGSLSLATSAQDDFKWWSSTQPWITKTSVIKPRLHQFKKCHAWRPESDAWRLPWVITGNPNLASPTKFTPCVLSDWNNEFAIRYREIIFHWSHPRRC